MVLAKTNAGLLVGEVVVRLMDKSGCVRALDPTQGLGFRV